MFGIFSWCTAPRGVAQSMDNRIAGYEAALDARGAEKAVRQDRPVLLSMRVTIKFHPRDSNVLATLTSCFLCWVSRN